MLAPLHRELTCSIPNALHSSPSCHQRIGNRAAHPRSAGGKHPSQHSVQQQKQPSAYQIKMSCCQRQCSQAQRSSGRGSVAPPAALALDAGGGEGGSGSIPPHPVDEQEPEGHGSDEDPEGILAKAGTSMEHLPRDMQEALGRGAISLAEVQQWLRLAATPLLGRLCQWWPALRDRVLGNPRLLVVLFTEWGIGCTAKMIAEYRARGENFWKEIDFVASDMSLEIIGDFAVVWLLSPRKSFSPLPKSVLGRVYKALPGHALQIGNFHMGQRVATFVVRGSQFFLVGFFSSLLGHGLTVNLAERKQRAKDAAVEAAAEARAALPAWKRGPAPAAEEAAPHLAPVLKNSLGWGAFMAASANVRYQLVNALEDRFMVKAIPNKAALVAASAAVRFCNTFVGSAQWVWLARRVGLQ